MLLVMLMCCVDLLDCGAGWTVGESDNREVRDVCSVLLCVRARSYVTTENGDRCVRECDRTEDSMEDLSLSLQCAKMTFRCLFLTYDW